MLGTTRIEIDGSEVIVRGQLRRRLLARLLISPNRPIPVERLREDLWDGKAPASAASTMKSHVSLLRRSIGPDRLTHADGAYLLRTAPGEIDVEVFERDADVGRAAVRAGEHEEAAAVLGRCLALWRGPAFADAADCDWAQPEAVRLEELRASVLDSWLESRLALGDHSAVIADAEAAVAEQPLR
ncbi:MAG TPA: AfsR/SARP family transcriptional regulator, partial [Acidimicrobiales bacterium]|nr:AfsR/SARP family transcriptional regulator [Acidimicrobiales bacterium]